MGVDQSSPSVAPHRAHGATCSCRSAQHTLCTEAVTPPSARHQETCHSADQCVSRQWMARHTTVLYHQCLGLDAHVCLQRMRAGAGGGRG